MKIELTPASDGDIDLVDIYLTVRELDHLSQSLRLWEADVRAGKLDSAWHTHINEDGDGPELTIAILPNDA